MQETYISVFSKLDTFEDGKPFKPWLHTIVTNKCLNFIKSKKAVFVSQDEIGELAGDDEEIIPAAWLERTEKRRDIMRIIDGLPEGQRMAVTLFYFEGLSISDMAGIMGVAEGTVKAHLYFSRKTIKEEVLREEKKGNKLYAIVPLPLLTQLFELEAETAVMPESMSQKVWEVTLQKLVSNGVLTGSAAANAPAAAAGSVKIGMTLAMKIIIGVVAAAVITAGAVFLPQMFNSSDQPTPLGVTDTSPIQSGTETPDNTPDATDTSPDDTTEPSNTPSETETSTPGTDDTRNVLRHTEPLMYNEELKADYENDWAALNEINGIDIDNYSKYLNVNISKDAIKVALITSIMTESGWDVVLITPEALNEVNDLLKANGENTFSGSNVEQNIAALWIAASLYFGLNEEDIAAMNNQYPGAQSCCFDIAMAITRARCDSSGPVHSLGIPLYIMQSAGHLDGMYADLFGLERH